MDAMTPEPSPQPIEPLIINLRDQRVILDSDLAGIYGVQTKALNQAVKRNLDRFPEDFMFQITADEWNNLKSQSVISSAEVVGEEKNEPLRSQSVTLKSGRGQHRKYMPFAFTEHGAIMAASILNSPEAVAMSVFVVRAFVQMRERLAVNAEILKRLAEIDKTLLEHNDALGIIWKQLQPLLEPPPDPPKRKIGFDYKGDEA
jgi:phage regulator Rha-like protein